MIHDLASSRRPTAPSHWEFDVVLADGGTVHVRPVRPDDTDRLVAFHAVLSDDTVFLRFFAGEATLSSDEVEWFTRVDHDGRVGLVAELGARLVGIARYDREVGTDSAEVAFVVSDEHQGRGIGTILLERLAAAARERGITRFVADTPTSNRQMLGVFAAAGFAEQIRREGDIVHVELLIEPTDRALAATEEREHQAEAASVARVLTPTSVAVIGASRNPATVGHQALRNLLAGGFVGTVYPVNPGAEQVASVKAYPTVLDIPGAVDLAVVAVPAASVLDVARQCAEKGVAGLVVLSAGFGEVGEVGVQAELRDLARRNGMRLVGPNCLGVANTAIGLDATFSPYAPARGRIAMQSQSGALGIAILERSARIGLGVSSFVSVGNKADVSGNDLLQYWEDDPNTDVVLLYLESFGNPRKFARIARRISRRKPIVAVKSGRSASGVRAASSHTAAMASPDIAVDALFRQAGVIRVDTLDELFDMALLLGSQPLPGGNRVAIVGNSGGPGILATDACDGAGLEVSELSKRTQASLRLVADPNASVSNPVDLVASATPKVYAQALEIVLADDAVDAAIVICTPTFAAPPPLIADVLRRSAASTQKPVLGCFLAWPDLQPLLRGAGEEHGGANVPAFASPEPAARALGRAARYATWRGRPPGAVRDVPAFDPDRARAVVDAFLARSPEGGWLPAADVNELLAAAGVPTVASATVGDAKEAARAAAELGFPVALKAVGAEIVHKSDAGGVRLGLQSEHEVENAYQSMVDHIGERMTGGMIQRMAAPGVETIVGMVDHALFGPLVMFGMGGTATELLGDRSFRILPLTDVDAAELVGSLRASPLLFGYRGAQPVAVSDLEDVLQRIAQLASHLPDLAELDLNPLIVSPGGVVAVDARAKASPAPLGEVMQNHAKPQHAAEPIEVLAGEAIDENPDMQTRRETFELELMAERRSEEGGTVELQEQVEHRRQR
jgi:acetyl coenzyme A synthetase (ADP forming)-like protein